VLVAHVEHHRVGEGTEGGICELLELAGRQLDGIERRGPHALAPAVAVQQRDRERAPSGPHQDPLRIAPPAR